MTDNTDKEPIGYQYDAELVHKLMLSNIHERAVILEEFVGKIRADERQRCIDAVEAEKFKDNDRCLNAAGYKFNEALDVAIKAIREAQGEP